MRERAKALGRFTPPRSWLLATGILVAAAALLAGRVLVVTVPIAQPDAIFSLTSHEWERLPSAATAAQENPQAVVLLSDPKEITRYNCNDCANRVDNLTRYGVRLDRIRMLPVSSNGTFWEAVACRQYLVQHGFRRLLVVTSPYHTLRAYATFAKVFADSGIALGIEPAWRNSKAQPNLWWLRYGDIRYVAYEWLAVASYVPRYGVYPRRL